MEELKVLFDSFRTVILKSREICAEDVKKRDTKDELTSKKRTFLCSGGLDAIIANMLFIKTMGGGILYLRVEDKYPYPYETIEKAFEYIFPKPGLTRKEYNFIKPLLEEQSYIYRVKEYRGESDIMYNLDNMYCLSLLPEVFEHTKGNLIFNIGETWGVQLNYTEPWLDVETSNVLDRRILVARTLNYQSGDPIYFGIRNSIINGGYFFGDKLERDAFSRCLGAEIMPLETKNALELAQNIKGMEFVVCNLNYVFWLAFSMGHKMIYNEICPDIYASIFMTDNVHYFQGKNYMNVEYTNKDIDLPTENTKEEKIENIE